MHIGWGAMKLKELHSLMQVRFGVSLSLRIAACLSMCCYVQDIAVFEDPKVELEQYPTGPHLASRFLFTVGTATWASMHCCTAVAAPGNLIHVHCAGGKCIQ